LPSGAFAGRRFKGIGHRRGRAFQAGNSNFAVFSRSHLFSFLCCSQIKALLKIRAAICRAARRKKRTNPQFGETLQKAGRQGRKKSMILIREQYRGVAIGGRHVLNCPEREAPRFFMRREQVITNEEAYALCLTT
jgi:hypothetical protein